MTTATADHLAAVAVELSYRVREDDPEANGAWLARQLPDPADWFRLAFVAAAAIPQDRSWRDLVGWTEQPLERRHDRTDRGERTGLQPCGTRAAYRRHLVYRETPCQPCRDAAATYKRKYSTRRNA